MKRFTLTLILACSAATALPAYAAMAPMAPMAPMSGMAGMAGMTHAAAATASGKAVAKASAARGKVYAVQPPGVQGRETTSRTAVPGR